jgi:hypothetical protein
MSMVRHVLAALAVATALAALGSAADPSKREGPPAKQGDPKILIENAGINQARLHRAFEAFRQKLAVLAGRLEVSTSTKDRDRAKSLRRALAFVGERGVEGKFESLIRNLTRKDADRDLDVLARVIQDNKELRRDLQKLIALMTEDDGDKRLAKRREDAMALLARLKEVRDKQARLQALGERGKHEGKELAKKQEKVTKETKDVLPPPDKDETKPAEIVRKPVEDAVKAQMKAEGQLSKNNLDGGGMAQGQAISKLDEAIKKLEEVVKQTRKEERERALANLLMLAKRMLALQIEIRDGTVQIDREIAKTADKKPTLVHAARANRLNDKQDESLKDAEKALKLVKEEGTAVAFAEIFEQVAKDMEWIRAYLARVDVGALTQTVENDVIDTLKDIIRALERAQKEEDPSPAMPAQGQSGKPKLVNRLQQLKMIMAMQRRINNRTEMYGKRYRGEQAPAVEVAVNDAEKQRFSAILKELRDLAGRQDRLGKVTREIGKQAAAERMQ